MKHPYKSHILASALACIASLGGAAQAAVSFSQSGNFVTMSVTGETFVVTTNQSEDMDVFVAFKDVFAAGGDAVYDGSRVAGNLTYSINGGGPVTANWWGGWNYRPGFQGPWTPQDAIFLIEVNPNTFVAGDSVTFNGSLTVDATSDPNAVMPDNFQPNSVTSVLGTGSKYISDLKSSNVSTVPEPGTVTLVGFGLLGLALRRRRH